MKKHTFFIKMLSVLLALLLTVFVVPATVYADVIDMVTEAFSNTSSDAPLPEASPSDVDSILTRVGEDVFEDKDLREENVKHFRLADGSYSAYLYDMPVHILDKNGKWQDIDNTLEDQNQEFATPDARIKFAKKITGNQTIFTLHEGNHKLTLSLDGAIKKTTGTAINTVTEFDESATLLQKLTTLDHLTSRIVYENILDGVDIEYVIKSRNIKENIIVKESKDSYSYTFTLALNNLSAALADDGSITLSDSESNDAIYTIPAPTATDADESRAPSGKVYYTLTDLGNHKYSLTVTADAEWMNHADRAFPVTIDPPVCVASANNMIDTYIDSGSPNLSYGSNTYLYAGKYTNTSGNEYISYWKVTSLPTLPAKATIVSSTLSLYCEDFYTQYDSSIHVGLYEATTAFSETSTWNTLSPATGTPDSSLLIDYAKVTSLDEYERISWDITQLSRKWHKNANQNKGIYLRGVDAFRARAVFASREAGSNAPLYEVNYRIVNGVESYWSYQSQNAGLAGTGHLNIAKGNLTFMFAGWSTDDAIMPYTPVLIYNTTQRNAYFNSSGYSTSLVGNTGYGWKLDSQQSITTKTYANSTSTSTRYYIWVDADGTEHAFMPYTDENDNTFYYDEDGLGLTLTYDSGMTNGIMFKIQDSHGYTICFDGSKRLIKEIDSFGNERIYNRDSEKVTSVSLKPAGRSAFTQIEYSYYKSNNTIVLTGIRYTGTNKSIRLYYSLYGSGGTVSTTSTGYLRKIEYVHTDSNTNNTVVDATIEYTYINGLLHLVSENLSSYRLEYGYNDQYAVSYVSEYGIDANGTSIGQKISFTYSDGKTVYRMSGSDDVYGNDDDILTTLLYDNSCRAISSYVTDLDGEHIYGSSTVSYVENTESETKLANKIKTAANSSTPTPNLLKDGSFELMSNRPWLSVNNTALARVTPGKNQSYALQTVFASGNTSAGFSQSVYLKPGIYTFSIYVKRTNGTANATVTLPTPSGTTNIKESDILSFSSTGLSPNDYVQLSTTFEVTTSSTYSLSVGIEKSQAMDVTTFVFDEAVLVQSGGAGVTSLIEDGGFEAGSWSGQKWDNDSTQLTQTEAHTGRYALALESNLNEVAIVGQTVYLMDTAKKNTIMGNSSYGENTEVKSFVLSAWGKANGVKLKEDYHFGIGVYVDFVKPGSSVVESKYYDLYFSDEISDWQFNSIPIILEPSLGYPVSMEIICSYVYNNGVAYFDDITLIESTETVDYTYDSEGRVIATVNGNGYSDSQTTYYPSTNSDAAGEVHKITYADGRSVEYTYENHKPSFEYHNDSEGNEVLINYTQYNTWGQPTYVGTVSENDEFVTQIYTYSDDTEIFGKVLTLEDTTGLIATYHYDTTTRLLMAITFSDGTGRAYSYDALGRQIEVKPATVSGTNYTPTENAEEVSFVYSDSSLTQIQTASTTYHFAYDIYGNRKSVAVGTNNIAYYIYNSYNGKLLYTVYGNGYVEKNIYDSLERISKVCYTQISGTLPTNDAAYDAYTYTDLYEYVYDSRGYLSTLIDYVAKKQYSYEYDSDGKPIRSIRYDRANGIVTADYYQTAVYNTFGELSQTVSSYRLNNLSYTDTRTYVYDEQHRLQTLYLGAENAANRITYTYDTLQRLNQVNTTYNGVTIANTYTYHTADGSYGETETSWVESFVSSIQNGSTSQNTAFAYTYDTKGNITAIRQDGVLKYSYEYDDIDQLIRENNVVAGKTYLYTYDNAGNITSKKTYPYTIASTASVASKTPTATYTYTYEDANWGDRLSSYRDVPFAYDSLGNPLIYYNGTSYTMQWQNGRQLTSAAKGSTIYTFTYDAEGRRTSKRWSSGRIILYVWDGDLLIGEYVVGQKNVTYTYDATGSPVGFTYTDLTGYYEGGVPCSFLYRKNAQGDIIGIVDSSGNEFVKYNYDAWGNLISYTMHGDGLYSLHYNLAEDNPFRYRGYYYDRETGFYYLNSRYYDPAIGRFINADSQLNIGEGVLGCNMYAYCLNNPVNGYDPCGTCFHRWDFWNDCDKCGGKNLGTKFVDAVSAAGSAVVSAGKAVGNFAVTAGKAVGSFAVTAGKAVGSFAVTAGKAVGNFAVTVGEAVGNFAVTTGKAARDFVVDRFSTLEKASNTLSALGWALDASATYCGGVAANLSIPTLGMSIPTAGTAAAILAIASLPFHGAALIIDILNEE
ncbi:MAG: RHS repeat-associated core domain-containing protein [Clostridia bacterium]|nr:RHS repeat-associated core domain-containing protein [Clostridia bacterium]